MAEEIQKGTRVLESISNNSNKITTIKITKKTKSRIDNIKVYPRETYEEIMQRILEILNLSRNNPERAQARLISIEKERKRNFKEEK